MKELFKPLPRDVIASIVMGALFLMIWCFVWEQEQKKQQQPPADRFAAPIPFDGQSFQPSAVSRQPSAPSNQLDIGPLFNN